MTSKEALGLLVSRVQVGAYKEEMQKCFDIVNKAINKLEKRDTPMKVIMIDFNAYCDNCGNNLFRKPQTYCDECGQKLEWSVDV